MYTNLVHDPRIKALDRRSKELVRVVCDALTPAVSGLRVRAGERLPPARLLRVRDGCFSCVRDGKEIYVLEEDDLVGAAGDPGCVSSEFTVVCDAFDRVPFLEGVRRDPALFAAWDEYVTCQFGLLEGVAAAGRSAEVVLKPEIRSYGAGDAIIEEGGDDKEVFSLVEGRAAVFVRAEQVGAIEGDELFGVIGALTDGGRRASVVATEPSMAVVLGRDQLVDLVRSRPMTLLKLLEDFARSVSTGRGREGSSVGKFL